MTPPKQPERSALALTIQYILQALLVSAILGLVGAALDTRIRVSVIESRIFSTEDRNKLLTDSARVVTLLDELQKRESATSTELRNIKEQVDKLSVTIEYIANSGG